MKNIFLVFLALILTSCAASRTSVRPDLSDVSHLHYILAVEAEFSNDWEEVLKQLTLALKEDPGSAYLKTEIGQAYLKMERTEDAIRSIEGVIAETPEYEPALSLLSQLYARQKEFQRRSRCIRN